MADYPSQADEVMQNVQAGGSERALSPPAPRPDYSTRPDRLAQALPNTNPSNVLGVFGLSVRTRERDLEDEFSKMGTVEKVVIVYDQRSERSRGFGFVTMREIQDAERCIAELNGMELHGRQLRVDFSTTKKPHNPTPGEYMGERREDPYADRRGGGDDRWASSGGGGGGGRRDDRRDDRYGGGGRDSYGGDRRDYGRDSRDSRDSYGGGRDSYRSDRDSGRDYRDSDRDYRSGGGSRDEYRRRSRSPRRRSVSPRRERRPSPPVKTEDSVARQEGGW